MAGEWWNVADIFDRMGWTNQSSDLGPVEEFGGFAPSDPGAGDLFGSAQDFPFPRSTVPSSIDPFGSYEAAIRTPAQPGWTESIADVLQSIGKGAGAVVNRFLTPTSAAQQPARTVSLSDRLRSGSIASPSRGQQFQMALAGSSGRWWALAAVVGALILMARR